MKQKKAKSRKNKTYKPANRPVVTQEEKIVAVEKESVVEKSHKYALPVKEIKKDLTKTVIFAVFAFLVIVATHYLLPNMDSLSDILAKLK